MVSGAEEATRKPISSQTSCAAFWVKGIAEALELEGLDLAALFAEASLDLAALNDPDARFTYSSYNRCSASARKLHADVQAISAFLTTSIIITGLTAMLEKADRPAHRVIPKSRFAKLETIEEVIEKLIGV
jgi:hypothetical protein